MGESVDGHPDRVGDGSAFPVLHVVREVAGAVDVGEQAVEDLLVLVGLEGLEDARSCVLLQPLVQGLDGGAVSGAGHEALAGGVVHQGVLGGLLALVPRREAEVAAAAVVDRHVGRGSRLGDAAARHDDADDQGRQDALAIHALNTLLNCLV